MAVDWVNGYTFVGSDGSGHSIVFDAPEKGVSRGMSPMQALLASLGACSGMDVVAVLKKRKQQLTSLKVSVSGLRSECGYPKPYTSISLRYVDRQRPQERLRRRGREDQHGEVLQRGCHSERPGQDRLQLRDNRGLDR
jgi:uncharacterized OsmC-like protein